MKTRTLPLLILTALLAGSIHATAQEEEPAPPMTPERQAAAWAAESMDPAALRILRDHGYLILQEDKAGMRLQFIDRKALEASARQSAAALAFVEAYRRFTSGDLVGDGRDGRGKTLGFAALDEFPATGLMTPALRAAMQLLIAAQEDLSALKHDNAAALSAEKNLFETGWGRSFAEAARADVLPDPSHLADAFFEKHFAGVNRDEDAAAHLQQYVAAAYKKDLEPLIKADTRNANLSSELRDWIKRYLYDQRRLVSIRRDRDALARLSSKTNLDSQWTDLETAALALSKPGFVKKLAGLLEGKWPAMPLKLTSGGFHLHRPVHLGRFEKGDAVTVSGVYWLDGLDEGEKTAIQVTTFLDRGEDGLSEALTKTVKRGNGGPYTFERRVVLSSSRDFIFRAIIGSPESNTLSGDATVQVSEAFDQALAAVASADHQVLDCRFAEAEESYAVLLDKFAPAAEAKKQYAGLLSIARKRRDLAREYAHSLAKLEEAIGASRADLSPEKCAYLTKRTQAAISLLSKLPSGCDRFLPDLRSQLETIQRRLSDQASFRELRDESRPLADDCQHASSVDSMAQALAILDADPAARCGGLEEDARFLEDTIPLHRVTGLWSEEFGRKIMHAENPPLEGADPAATALGIVNPALARIPTLPTSHCFDEHKESFGTLASSWGRTLLPPEDAAAAKLMPDDGKLVAISQDVAKERRRIEGARAAVEARDGEQELPMILLTPKKDPDKKEDPDKKKDEKSQKRGKSRSKR